MKTRVLLALVCALLMCLNAASANDMGVQVIGGPVLDTEPVSLDDFALKTDVEIAGYGILTGLSFEFVDNLLYYYNQNYTKKYKSGADADYALLRIDIVNTALRERNFLVNCTVKAIYDDVYEYGGWCYQYNYDRNDDAVLGEKDLEFPIQPMYQGHYAFGATLPNAVVKGSGSLRIEIDLGGNQITYYVRR